MYKLLLTIVVLLLLILMVYRLSTKDRRAIAANRGERSQQFLITVDYNLGFDQQLAQGPAFYEVSQNITKENFPIVGTQRTTVKMTLLKPLAPLKFEQALAELEKLKLTPARIEHLLALHVAQPELSLFNSGPIWALGSVWNSPENGPMVATLETFGDLKLDGKTGILKENYAGYIEMEDSWIAGISEE